jgi:hypothetical protein
MRLPPPGGDPLVGRHAPQVRIAIVLDNYSPHLSTKRDQRVGESAPAHNVELVPHWHSGSVVLEDPLETLSAVGQFASTDLERRAVKHVQAKRIPRAQGCAADHGVREVDRGEFESGT